MEWLAEYGYIGLFFGAFLAATLIPFSSDFLLVGLLAAGGDPILTVLSASIGNWLGGLSCYGLGWLGRLDRIEKWLRIKPDKIEKQKERIVKYSALAAFLTWLPAIGDLLAVGLGFYRINFPKTSLFMLLGKTSRYILWTVIYFAVR